MRSSHSVVFFDHLRGFLGNHNSRRVGVSADESRHDTGINHSQAAHTVNTEALIHDGHWVSLWAHFACACVVESGFGAIASGTSQPFVTPFDERFAAD